MDEEIIVGNNIKIEVEKSEDDNHQVILIHMQSNAHCRLHWGLSRKIGETWKIAEPSNWPNNTIAFDKSALQTPFITEDGENRITIKLDKEMELSILNFAIFYPDTNRWDNNSGNNYHIELLKRNKKNFPLHKIREELIKKGEVLYEKVHDIGEEEKLFVAVIKKMNSFSVIFVSNIPENLILHWGVASESPYEWTLPPNSIWPEGTNVFDDKAVHSAFIVQNDLNQLVIDLNGEKLPVGIPFVLTFLDGKRWLKERGRNFYIPVDELVNKDKYSGSDNCSQLASEIIGMETGGNSWTLMHRFNLCYDLLDKTGNEEQGLALIFVWMRYSSLRQLDWQRNYNTQPKELSHAQDRLTLKLADFYSSATDNSREWIRLIMSTLGRGGEGQRIRDEILHIMHRHRIKEVSGHFMEEWHQKLHNNTTPDDIEICKAYIEFLRSDGNLDLFYKTLESGGVSKERLESFERPIRTHPDFIPHLKDALIYDFENYLKLFKSVHSGTDLECASESARYLFNDEMHGLLNHIFEHRHDVTISIENIIETITKLRNHLNNILKHESEHGKIRDIIYLDIALEECTRTVVERSLTKTMDRDQLVELISMVLKNILHSSYNFEFSENVKHWDLLKTLPRFDQEWSLHAKSVVDRIARAITAMSDRYYALLQAKAIFLGKAFNAENWTIDMFSEEIVRGRLSFILSLLVHHIDPILRKNAKLGDWQIISPGQANGVVEIVESLRTIQEKKFEKPTIVIAENVYGDEEPPEGLNAVITPDLVDLVSHVAIRARNSSLLFATCYDRDTLQRLKSFKGSAVALTVNASGDVVIEESIDKGNIEPLDIKRPHKDMVRPAFSNFAITSKEFDKNIVGGKSLNLHSLHGKLPDWIHTPTSVAIPFTVFEKVVDMDKNREIANNLNTLVKEISKNPGEILSEMRKTILDLGAPDELISSIHKVMRESSMEQLEDWNEAWMCIKKVWASKWNDIAYVSRRTRGIAHNDLFMAVLIQQVVKAEYAFVIHTANPFSGDERELYAEIVSGLGETLVGNYPGRALSFTSLKTTPEPSIFAYPSKSIGLFGGSLIFRSDSNGEDLEGYAGAGLYDSIHLETPKEVSLKYSEEPLIWNEGFRKEMLITITKLGIAVEEAMQSPQDIEGVYTNGQYYVVQTRPQV